MDLLDIERDLHHADFQYRLKAVAALREQPAAIAVPLLRAQVEDPEFLVRTFVARALGHHQNADTFAALLSLLKWDNTPNVRAEAANSLSLFGAIAVSHLTNAFRRDEHWLVRQSILGALLEMDCPAAVLEICTTALEGDDATVQAAAVSALSSLAATDVEADALALLLSLVQHDVWRIRQRVALALKHFSGPRTQAALTFLRQDVEPRVIAATWPNPLGAAAEDVL